MLKQYKLYSRQDVQQISEPNYNFQPSTGSWGLSGIVRIKKSGNYVFFVTLDKGTSAYKYKDKLQKDGTFIWESQNRHNQNSKFIKEMINFDHKKNSIYLFVRKQKKNDFGNAAKYLYLGNLKYLTHDPHSNNPVEFTWQILNWDPNEPNLQLLF